jgi:hypothetical protein
MRISMRGRSRQAFSHQTVMSFDLDTDSVPAMKNASFIESREVYAPAVRVRIGRIFLVR